MSRRIEKCPECGMPIYWDADLPTSQEIMIDARTDRLHSHPVKDETGLVVGWQRPRPRRRKGYQPPASGGIYFEPPDA